MPRIEYVNKFTGQFDEDLFAEIREKRLSNLLTKEVTQDESKWLNYFFENSQVKIDITDMILEDLIHEICIVVNSVQESRENGGKSIWSEELP